MLASRHKGKKINDTVFSTSIKAKEAKIKYGAENVVNATIGSLYTEDEKLATYGVVEEVFRNLPSEDIFSYASNFIGEKDFLIEIRKSILGENYKEQFSDFYFDAIATPGGTGALSSTIKNYVNAGEKVLIPEWMWGSYKTIVKEYHGVPLYYKLFTEDFKFDVKSLRKEIMELVNNQDNLLILINDPAHNPTGMRLTFEEWKEIMEILKEACKHTDVILLKDIAYFEYDDRSQEEQEKINSLMKDIPSNMLIVYAFSLSKAMSMYGLRIGAQFAMSKEKEVIDEFHDAAAYSCRVTWSNACKSGMKTYLKIMQDENLKKRYLEEKEDLKALLKERSNIFLKEADECSLKHLPYKSGFFITIPLGEKNLEIIAELEKNNIFTVPFNDGIRIGLCSVPIRKIKGLAKRIKNIIDEAYKN